MEDNVIKHNLEIWNTTWPNGGRLQILIIIIRIINHEKKRWNFIDVVTILVHLYTHLDIRAHRVEQKADILELRAWRSKKTRPRTINSKIHVGFRFVFEFSWIRCWAGNSWCSRFLSIVNSITWIQADLQPCFPAKHSIKCWKQDVLNNKLWVVTLFRTSLICTWIVRPKSKTLCLILSWNVSKPLRAK